MGKRLFGTVLLGLCLFILTLGCVSVRAQGINRQVSYQGKLLDSTGVPVADGAYQMKFSLYSAASGGVALWAASGTTAVPTAIPVTVQGGLFSLMLGDPSALGGWQNTLDGIDWNSSSIYLGVTIAADGEMSPRKRLGAVPQAFNAEQLQGMSASSSVSGGQSLFVVHQTENNAATGTRSALEVRTDGTSAANDLLFRGVDGGPNVTTFSINRLGSVTSTGQFAFLGDGTSTVSGSLSVVGNVSSTVLYAANATLALLTATTLNASSLVWTNATGTNTTSTNLYATLFGFDTANGTSVTTTNAYAAFHQFANALGINATTTNSYATFSQFENSLGTNSTSTNSYAGFLQFANALGINVTTTNSYADFAQFRNALGTNVTSTNLDVIGTTTSTFGGSLSVAGNVSSTGLYAVNAVLETLNATTLNASSLVWTNATGTNTTSTNLYATLFGFDTANGMSVTTTNLYTNSLEFQNASGTSATTTNLFARHITTDDAQALVRTDSQIPLVASVAIGSDASTVLTDDRFAVVLHKTASSFDLFDLASSTRPVLITTFFVPGGSMLTDGFLQGNLLFLTSAVGNYARIYDLRDGNVTLRGTLSGVAAQSISVQGGYAYMVNGSNLTIADISNPDRPSIVSSIGAAGLSPNRITVKGRYAYVTHSGSGNTYIYEVTDPYHPHVLSTSPLSTGTNDVVAQGSYAYVGGAMGIDVITAYTPATPSSVLYGGIINIQSLALAGRYLLATRASEWSVVDVSNAASPQLVQTLSGGLPRGIAVRGRYVFVTDAGSNNLLVYQLPGIEAAGIEVGAANIGVLQVLGDGKIGHSLDVGDGLVVGFGGIRSQGGFAVSATNTTSTVLGNFMVGTSSRDVAMHSGFVMDGDDMFVGGNIGSASSVYTNGSFIAGTGSTYYNAASLVNTTGDYTVTSTGNLTLNANGQLNIAAPLGILPTIDGTMFGNSTNRFNGEFLNTTTTNATTTNSYADFAQFGNALGTNATTTNLYTNSLEFQNASGTSATTTNLFARHITTDDAQALVRTDSQIPLVASVAMTAIPGTVLINDRFAVVLHTATDQFTLFDLASSTRPVNIGLFSTAGTGLVNGFLQGHLLFLTYLGLGAGGVLVYDIGDGIVTLRGALGGYENDIDVQGGYAYMVNGSNLTIADISNPDRPYVVSSIGAGVAPNHVTVKGRYAYVTDSTAATTMVYEVTDPYHPHVLSGALPTGTNDVIAQGSYAYVAGATGVNIINATIPSTPSIVTNYTGISSVQSLALAGRYLLAGTNADWNIIDISNTATPQLLQTIASGYTGGIAIRGRYVFVTDGGSNLLVYQLPGIETAGIEVGAANIGMLQVLGDGKIGHSLDVGDGLVVGFGGIRSQGGFAVSATNTTSTILGNFMVGTSSRDVAMHAGFVMDGDDMFVGGNIGSASSVYTNGSFIAGTGSTYYNAASLVNTTGDYTVTSTGNLTLNANGQLNIAAPLGILPTIDGTMFGNSTNRFNGEFLNTTTTNATSTNIYTSLFGFGSANGVNVTTTNSYASFAQFGNALGTNVTSTSLAVTGTATSTFGGSLSVAGNVSSTGLYAVNAVLETLNAITLNASSLVWTNATGTNTTSTNLYATLFGFDTANGTSVTTTNAYAAFQQFANALGINSTTTNLYASFAQFENSLGTNSTSTNSYAGFLQFANALGINVTTTNSYADFAQFRNALGTNVTSTNLDVIGTTTSTFGGSLSVAGNVSSTGLYAVNAVLETLNATTLNASSLVWTNATGTNTTSTNLYATLFGFGTANGTSVTTTNFYTTSLNTANATTTNLYTNSLEFQNASGTSATTTNLFARHITTDDGLALVRTDSQIPLVASVAMQAGASTVLTNDRFAVVLYKAAGTFDVFDLASSTRPVHLGNFPSVCTDINDGFLQSHLLFLVCANDSVVHIFDLGDGSMALRGTLDTGGIDKPLSVSVQGAYVYVVTDGNRLVIADISNPDRPHVISSIGTTDVFPNHIVVKGRYAYVTHLITGTTRIYEVTDPYHPHVLSGALSTGYAGVVTQGSYAYVAGTTGISVINATIPSTPSIVTSYTGITNVQSLAISGRYLLATTSTGWHVIDVLNTASPQLMQSMYVGASAPGGIAVRGRYVFVTDTATNNLLVYQLPGIEAAGIEVGAANIGLLQVLGDGKIGHSLDVGDGLVVGFGGIRSQGGFAVSATNTTSTVLGNFMVGTSSRDVAMHSGFVMDGDDMFVGGNIGSASSVYTNGSFIAGTGSTYYNAASLVNTTGNYTVTSTGNLILNANGQLAIAAPLGIMPTLDGTNFGSASYRFNGQFLNTTTTNATSTNTYTSLLGFGTANGTSVTTTNNYATFLQFANALGTNVTSTNLDVIGTSTSTFGGSISVAGNVSSTGLYAVNAALMTLNATTINAASLVWTNATGTNTTSTNLYATLFGFGTANGMSVTTTNSYASFAQFGNALGTNVTSTNLDVTGSGTSTFGGSLSVRDTVSSTRMIVDSLFTAYGTSTLYGDVTLGNASTNSILGSGRFARSLVPMTDNAYDLGSSSLSWSTGYFTNVTSTNATTTNLFARHVVTDDAQALVRTDSQIPLVASVAIGSGASTVLTDDRFAVVLHKSASTFDVFDLASSTRPVLITTVSVSGGSALTDGFLQGNLLFLTSVIGNYARIYDIRDGNVTLRGTLSGVAAQSISVQGGYAYIVTNDNKFVIADLSNPDRPYVVASITTTTLGPKRVTVKGRFAYVTSNTFSRRTVIYEVTDPYHPHALSDALNTDYTDITDIVAQGSYAYVAGTGGIYVINALVPATPLVVSYTGITNVQSLALAGRYLLATTSTGWSIIDVLDPAPPQLMQSIYVGTSAPGDIAVRGRYVFVTDTATNNLLVYQLPGIEAAGIEVGAANIGMLQVLGDGKIGHSLDIGDGLVVGYGGIRSQGGFAVSATNTTSTILGNFMVGTSSRDVAMHSGFVMDGDDMFVGGNIGSASSVYTNGSFIAGTGSTYYNAASLVNTTGNYTVTSTGNLILNANGQLSIAAPLGIIPTIDGTIFGNSTNRFNGEFLNTTTTNATTTNFYTNSLEFQNASGTSATTTNFYTTSLNAANATTTNLYTNSLEFQNASGTSATTTNLFARHIVTDDAQALVRTDSQIPLVASVATDVITPDMVLVNDQFAVVLDRPIGQFNLFDLASSTRPVRIVTSIPWGVAITDGFLQGHSLFLASAAGSVVNIYDLQATGVQLRGALSGVAANSISVQGAYIYIVTSDNKLVIADISNPYRPRQISSITAAGTTPVRITVKGRYAYVTDSIAAATYVYEVTDPYHPHVLGDALSTTGRTNDVVAQGSYVYTGGSDGVCVITAYALSAPLASCHPSGEIGSATSLAIAGRYLFAAQTTLGWNVLDVSNTAAPQLIQTIGSGVVPGGIAVRGRYVFVTDTTTRNLLVYQLPGIEAAGIEVGAANIGMLQVLGDGKIGHSLDVGDGLVVGYGGIRSQGGFAVSATNTTSTILGNFMVGTSSRDVAMHSGFVMDGDDMFVGGNIGSASSVYTNGSFIAGTGSTYYNAASIVNTTGDFTVTSTGNLTLNANGQLSISAPAGIIPTIDGTIFGSATNRFSGEFLNTTTTNATTTNLYTNSLGIRDTINQPISSASNWTVKSVATVGSIVRGVEIVGDYAYTVSQSTFYISDIRNPSAPVMVGNLPLNANNQDVAIYGDYAYVAASGTSAIYVINISNPVNPTVENTVTETIAPTSIEIQGRYAYVTENAVGGGLAIFDLGHATGPRLLSRTPLPSSLLGANDVTVLGRYAYVTRTSSNSLYVLDVSDPVHVVVVDYRSLGAFQPNVIVGQGGYLYVSDAASSNIQIRSATTSFSLVGTVSLSNGVIPDLPNGLTIHGNYLYASQDNSGYLEAVDVSVPASPVIAKSFSLGAGIGGSVNIVGRYAYIGNRSSNTVSIVDLGGIEAANAHVSSLQAGELSVSGDGRVGGSMFLTGGMNVGQGIMAYGTSAIAASSTGPSAQFMNRADHATQKSSWGAYVDRLLVGTESTATGTNAYSMIVSYSSADGLCLKRTTGFCPNQGLDEVYSIMADDWISAVGYKTQGFDMAESYTTDGVVTSTDVLVFGSVSTTAAQSSGLRYDPRIMGVASTRPGYVLGAIPGGVKVALSGRVPTKVSPVNGTIAIGDPLTTSEYPGVAMKATKPGMILGYALEPATATSTIEVFIKTGYSAGTILNTDGTVARLSDDLVVDSRTVATEHAQTVDSWGLTFRGSAWNEGTVTQPSFSLITNVVTATSSAFVIRNASSSSVFAIDQAGTATIAGDLVIGGHLYPSGRGAAQNSKYIFLDDTSTSTQYMATNADGWQANDSYDFAERYYSPDALDTGDLVIASDRGQFHVQRSLNETGLLMGIVSTRPAFVAGKQGADMYPVALAGRVPTKVSSMNGAIKVGDALAPSTIPGTAVKATKAGPIVGLALENYDAATVGKIEVFVNPGWWGGAEGGATGNTQHVSTEGTPTNGMAPATVNADGSVAYRGFASIAAGSKRVHVAYDSVLSYPNIQATPRGQVRGGWWTDNYTDIGFDVFMSEIQTHDVSFAWSVEGTPTGARIYLSDGTYALVNPTTGEAVVQTIATSTESGAPSIGNRVSGIENGESSAVVTTPAAPVAPTPVETPSALVPSSATTTVESPPVTTTTIDSSTGSVMSSSASEAGATQSDTSGSTSTNGE